MKMIKVLIPVLFVAVLTATSGVYAQQLPPPPKPPHAPPPPPKLPHHAKLHIRAPHIKRIKLKLPPPPPAPPHP